MKRALKLYNRFELDFIFNSKRNLGKAFFYISSFSRNQHLNIRYHIFYTISCTLKPYFPKKLKILSSFKTWFTSRQNPWRTSVHTDEWWTLMNYVCHACIMKTKAKSVQTVCDTAMQLEALTNPLELSELHKRFNQRYKNLFHKNCQIDPFFSS